MKLQTNSENVVELSFNRPAVGAYDDPIEDLMTEFDHLEDELDDYDEPEVVCEQVDPYSMSNGELIDYIGKQMKDLKEMKDRVKYYLDDIKLHVG